MILISIIVWECYSYFSLQDEYSLIINSKFRLVCVSEWMLVLS